MRTHAGRSANSNSSSTRSLIRRLSSFVEHLRAHHRAPTEGHQLSHELARRVRNLLDLGDVLERVGREPRFEREQIGGAEDHREQIVEVVSDAPREPTHGLQLLALADALLEPAGLAAIFEQRHATDRVPIGVAQRRGVHADLDVGPVLALADAVDPGVSDPLHHDLVEQLLEALALALGHQRIGLAQHLLARPTEHPLGRTVPHDHALVAIERRDRQGRGFDHQVEGLTRDSKLLGEARLAREALGGDGVHDRPAAHPPPAAHLPTDQFDELVPSSLAAECRLALGQRRRPGQELGQFHATHRCVRQLGQPREVGVELEHHAARVEQADANLVARSDFVGHESAYPCVWAAAELIADCRGETTHTCRARTRALGAESTEAATRRLRHGDARLIRQICAASGRRADQD
jgi:hypothetical protein